MRSFTWLPDLLSSTRFFLAPVVGYALHHQMWGWAALGWLSAVVSDLLDGSLARRFGCDNGVLGRLLDHGADACFVTTCLLVLALQGSITPLLAPLIALAFVFYLTDHLRGKSAGPSALGKTNGVAYYILAGLPLLQGLLHWDWLKQPVLMLSWGLVISTLWLIVRRLFLRQ